jgi:hypothetical protein
MSPPSARVLTTAELGSIRYAASSAAALWPVEVVYTDGAAPFQAFGAPAPLTLTLHTGTSADFERAARGEWRAVLPAPPGHLTYIVARGIEHLADGSLQVSAPHPPNAAPGLASRAPSGAKQLPVEADSDERTVEFVYAEETWSVREVFVEAEDQAPELMRLDGGQYVASLRLPVGLARYRFRVVLREACRPDTAPFTRLGWDAGATNSSGLTTWELGIDVADSVHISDGVDDDATAAEKSPVKEAVSKAVEAHCPLIREKKDSSGLCDEEDLPSVASVSVRDAAMRLEKAVNVGSEPALQASPIVVSGTGMVRGLVASVEANAGAEAAASAAAVAAAASAANSSVRTAKSAREGRRGDSWVSGVLASVGVGLSVGLVAVALVLLDKRGVHDEADEEENSRERSASSVVRSGLLPEGQSYFKHAQTQGS